MKLDRLTATDFDLHVEAEELAALVTAVRCALEPGCVELSAATHELMTRFLAEYDEQATKAARTPYRAARPVTLRMNPPVDDSYGRVMYDPM